MHTGALLLNLSTNFNNFCNSTRICLPLLSVSPNHQIHNGELLSIWTFAARIHYFHYYLRHFISNSSLPNLQDKDLVLYSIPARLTLYVCLELSNSIYQLIDWSWNHWLHWPCHWRWPGTELYFWPICCADSTSASRADVLCCVNLHYPRPAHPAAKSRKAFLDQA